MTVVIDQNSYSTNKIYPILKTILFTPGETTGAEDIFDASGNLNFTNTERHTKVERWGLPFMLVGNPGVSKTSQLKAACNAMGLKCFTLIASLCDPTDFRGIPTIAKLKIEDPNGEIKRYKGTESIIATGKEPLYTEEFSVLISEDGKVIKRKQGETFTPRRGEPIHEWDGSLKRKKQTIQVSRTAIPEIYIKIAELGDCVLFLDEFSTAPPAVQAALLRVALDLVVGEFKLPAGVRIIAAMNPTDIAANGSDIALPLANRFGHYTFDNPSNETWCEYMLSNSNNIAPIIDYKKEQERVLSLWDEKFAQAKGLVCGYMQRRGPDTLFKMPQKEDDKASAAWPSPRTWSMATRVLAGSMIHGLNEKDRNELLMAFVGTAATSEFLTFIREVDLPNPIDLLDGKISFMHDIHRLDRTAATLSAMLAYILIPSKEVNEHTQAVKKTRTTNFWTIIEHVYAKTPDMVVPIASILCAKGFIGVKGTQMIQKMGTLLTGSGYRHEQ